MEDHTRGVRHLNCKRGFDLAEARTDFIDEKDKVTLLKAYNLRQSNPVVSLEMLRDLAKSGSIMSMVYIGSAYRDGRGVAIDWQEAKGWYDRARQAGSIHGMYLLAHIYIKEKDFDAAERVLREGERLGNPSSLYWLARIYYKGPILFRNKSESLRLLDKASKNGHIFAKRDFGIILMRGALGFMGRIRGLFIYTDGLIRAFKVARVQPNSPRLKRDGLY